MFHSLAHSPEMAVKAEAKPVQNQGPGTPYWQISYRDDRAQVSGPSHTAIITRELEQKLCSRGCEVQAHANTLSREGCPLITIL